MYSKRQVLLLWQKIMSNPDYSKQSYFDFIEYVSKKGLIKQATASNWKNASIRLLAILDDNEAHDLRELDIDALCSRFNNLEGKSITPSSMQVYRSRLKTAVGDFIAYTNNPMSYKPGISQRTSRKKTSKNKEVSSFQETNQSHTTEHNDPPHKPKGITFPVPLRADLVVEIRYLPFDLTEQEAEKIGMVIKALAMNNSLKE